ncbi:MAG: site-2 protease family protein [Deltaproteobacteria bacterium]|nr:site-2 protease family protein [Deltaproteobacteria bacterium]
MVLVVAAVVHEQPQAVTLAGADAPVRPEVAVVAAVVDEEGHGPVVRQADGGAQRRPLGVVRVVAAALEKGGKREVGRGSLRVEEPVVAVVTGRVGQHADAHPVASALHEGRAHVAVVALLVAQQREPAGEMRAGLVAPPAEGRALAERGVRGAGRLRRVEEQDLVDDHLVGVVARGVVQGPEGGDPAKALRGAERAVLVIAAAVVEHGDADQGRALRSVLRLVAVRAAVVPEHAHAEVGEALALAQRPVDILAAAIVEQEAVAENARALARLPALAIGPPPLCVAGIAAVLVRGQQPRLVVGARHLLVAVGVVAAEIDVDRDGMAGRRGGASGDEVAVVAAGIDHQEKRTAKARIGRRIVDVVRRAPQQHRAERGVGIELEGLAGGGQRGKPGLVDRLGEARRALVEHRRALLTSAEQAGVLVGVGIETWSGRRKPVVGAALEDLDEACLARHHGKALVPQRLGIEHTDEHAGGGGLELDRHGGSRRRSSGRVPGRAGVEPIDGPDERRGGIGRGEEAAHLQRQVERGGRVGDERGNRMIAGDSDVGAAGHVAAIAGDRADILLQGVEERQSRRVVREMSARLLVERLRDPDRAVEPDCIQELGEQIVGPQAGRAGEGLLLGPDEALAPGSRTAFAPAAADAARARGAAHSSRAGRAARAGSRGLLLTTRARRACRQALAARERRHRPPPEPLHDRTATLYCHAYASPARPRVPGACGKPTALTARRLSVHRPRTRDRAMPGPDDSRHAPETALPPGHTRRTGWGLPIVLFVLTVASVFLSGALQVYPEGQAFFGRALARALPQGWVFAVPLMAILLTHELGHYLAARRHGVDVSLPYFIPMPIGPLGTMGAIISMRERIRSRNALLDIGAAGPLAGLAVALPVLAIGLWQSPVRPVTSPGYLEGQCLLYSALKLAVVGPIPAGHDVFLTPTAFAGWAGLLVTALNLLPIGQLDGGHVAYALLGARQDRVARVLLLCLPGVFLYNLVAYRDAAPGMVWLVWFVVLAVLRRLSRGNHPPTDPGQLSRGRRAVALACLVLFVLLFMPTPMRAY